MSSDGILIFDKIECFQEFEFVEESAWRIKCEEGMGFSTDIRIFVTRSEDICSGF